MKIIKILLTNGNSEVTTIESNLHDSEVNELLNQTYNQKPVKWVCWDYVVNKFFNDPINWN